MIYDKPIQVTRAVHLEIESEGYRPSEFDRISSYLEDLLELKRLQNERNSLDARIGFLAARIEACRRG